MIIPGRDAVQTGVIVQHLGAHLEVGEEVDS